MVLFALSSTRDGSRIGVTVVPVPSSPEPAAISTRPVPTHRNRLIALVTQSAASIDFRFGPESINSSAVFPRSMRAPRLGRGVSALSDNEAIRSLEPSQRVRMPRCFLGACRRKTILEAVRNGVLEVVRKLLSGFFGKLLTCPPGWCQSLVYIRLALAEGTISP